MQDDHQASCAAIPCAQSHTPLTMSWNTGPLLLIPSGINKMGTKFLWKYHMLNFFPVPFDLRETTLREKLARRLVRKGKPPCHMPPRELRSCLQEAAYSPEERGWSLRQRWVWPGRKARSGKGSWKVWVRLSKVRLFAWVGGSPGQQCHLASWSWNSCQSPKKNSLPQPGQNP